MSSFFNLSIDNAILMLQLSFFFSVMSFIMCLILFYKRHKDEVSRRIPLHHLGKNYLGEETEYPTDVDDENLPVTRKPTSTPYYMVIKNNSDSIKSCNLFGLGNYFFTKNFGSDEGLIVEMGQSNINYLFMLIQSAFNPFETSLIRLSSKNLKQLSEIITVTSKDANGQVCQIPIITANHIRPDGIGTFVDEEGKELGENDEKRVDVYYPVKVDFSTDLSFKILPNTELHLLMFPERKFNPMKSFTNLFASPRVKN